MILLHGAYGSGKSRALRELEARPPAGWRCVYAPVPTLALDDLARWCLDRLRRGPAGDPLAELAAAAGSEARLALLVDDADSLPLPTALGLRKLEGDANGVLRVVAACDAGSLAAPGVTALGAPVERIALDPELGLDAAAAADAVRTLLDGRPRASEPRRAVARGIPPRVAIAREAAHPTAPPRRAPMPPPVLAPASVRTVPLWLATVIGVVAFSLPLAFAIGFFLGRDAVDSEQLVPARRDPQLPSVAAGPRAADSAATLASETAADAVDGLGAATSAPARLPLDGAGEIARVEEREAPPIAALTPETAAPPGEPALPLTPPAASAEAPAAARPPEAPSSQDDAWAPPQLLRVEPVRGAP